MIWDWLKLEWRLIVPLAMAWLAVAWLLPREPARSRTLAGLVGIAAMLMFGWHFLPPSRDWLREAMFYIFAFSAVGTAALMITVRNPVYAALWFSVTTLSVCGLFLLNSAPFLAAATVIVYAGAIIVTFLFVIMLAQQEGATGYDRNSYQPAAASLLAFLLLGGMLFTLQSWGRLEEQLTLIVPDPAQPPAPQKYIRPSDANAGNALSRPSGDDLGSLRNVGRSLFTDYLYAVEIAGTVLLIATIGAIAIAPRRSRGTFSP
jgi:NADH-quinone oxidoreductase subunit J